MCLYVKIEKLGNILPEQFQMPQNNFLSPRDKLKVTLLEVTLKPQHIKTVQERISLLVYEITFILHGTI